MPSFATALAGLLYQVPRNLKCRQTSLGLDSGRALCMHVLRPNSRPTQVTNLGGQFTRTARYFATHQLLMGSLILLVAYGPCSCCSSFYSCLTAGSRRITIVVDFLQAVPCVFESAVQQLLQICSSLLLGHISSPFVLGQCDHVPTLRG